jgi:tetratricopeptide (TPR) repeat protein
VYKLPIILLFSLLLSVKPGQSQNHDFRHQDSTLYAFFVQENWQQVLKQGNQMLEQGYDYYFLHIRMGIAAYQMERYLLARKYFKKALVLYAKDPVANSYLYGTCLLLNQKNEAGAVSYSLSSTEKKSWKVPVGFSLESLHMDMGTQAFDHHHSIDFNTISGSDHFYGQSREYDQQTLWDAGIRFQLSQRVRAYFGIQNILIKADDVFAVQNYELLRDSTVIEDWGESYFYKVDSSQQINRFAHQIEQQSYYGQLNFGINENFSLTTALHVISWEQTQTQAEVVEGFASDTAYYFYDGSETSFFEIPLSNLEFNTIDFNSTDWAFYLGSQFQSILGETGISASIARISAQEYLQFNLGQTYYPFGNLKLYGSSTVSFLTGNKRNDWLFSQSLYIKLYKQNWIEASWSHGNHSGFNSGNAFLVYNTPYETLNRINTVLYAQLSNHLKLRLSYSWLDGQHSLATISQNNENLNTEYLSFQSNLITGGIQWNF